MRQSKYIQNLRPLLEVPLFTVKDAQSRGVPRHVIAYYVKTGILERLYPGAFRSHDMTGGWVR